jgi:hypothetical protein
LELIGRSRRSFILTDINVNIDADTMIADAKEMWDTNYEKLVNNNRFEHSLGQ